jgi:hypothetical protein
VESARASSDTTPWEAKRAAWRKAGEDGRALDRERARRQTPEQRIAEGLELIRIAGKLRTGRRLSP